MSITLEHTNNNKNFRDLLKDLNVKNGKSFYLKLIQHVNKHFIAYMLLILCIFLFKQNYAIAVNNSPSLPGTIFIVHYGEMPSKIGDLVMFNQDTKYKKKHYNYVKIYAGVAGDKLIRKDNEMYVNNTFVGVIKERGTTGALLSPIQETIIPEGRFFARGTHEYSYDSRYQEFGLPYTAKIKGLAYKVF